MEEQGSLELRDISNVPIVVNYRQATFANGPGPQDKGTTIRLSKWSTLEYLKSRISELEGPWDPIPPEKQDLRSIKEDQLMDENTLEASGLGGEHSRIRLNEMLNGEVCAVGDTWYELAV